MRILSCQNWGDVLVHQQGANDVGGIVGKVQFVNADDVMTINVTDCVNGRVKMQAAAMVSGIFNYLGPYKQTTNNVRLTIDRCRNLSTEMVTVDSATYGGNDSQTVCGIYGCRADSRWTTQPTVITNCFSVFNHSFQENLKAGVRKSPIASFRNAGNYTDGTGTPGQSNNPHLLLSNNYFILAQSVTGTFNSFANTGMMNGLSRSTASGESDVKIQDVKVYDIADALQEPKKRDTELYKDQYGQKGYYVYDWFFNGVEVSDDVKYGWTTDYTFAPKNKNIKSTDHSKYQIEITLDQPADISQIVFSCNGAWVNNFQGNLTFGFTVIADQEEQ